MRCIETLYFRHHYPNGTHFIDEQDKNLRYQLTIKTYGVSILLCLILCKSIIHNVLTYTTCILENPVFPTYAICILEKPVFPTYAICILEKPVFPTYAICILEKPVFPTYAICILEKPVFPTYAICILEKPVFPTYAICILEKLVSHINLRRSSKPVDEYNNSSAILRLILPGDVDSNPGPDKEGTSNRKRKQSKSIPTTCQVRWKAVKANVNRLLCIRSIETCSVKKIKSFDLQQWVCHNCHLIY